mgnify:CR=1 FL=1
MTDHPTDAQALADAVTQAMWSRDRATQGLGMQILSVKPGYAMIAMPVRGDMVAFSCNSYNQYPGASSCNLDFRAPAREGDVLEAEAIERSLSGRTGVYDITVRTRSGKTIALFRGKSYRINGEVIAGLQQADTRS